jgi:hypothetical protein
MPPTPAPYTRIIVDGIPYWKDTEGTLYYYEGSTHPTSDNRIQLGTQANGLRSDWELSLSSTLAAYRTAAAPRARARA